MKFSHTIAGAICVSGAFLIHFSLGCLYTFGNMSPYIASYLKMKTSSSWVTSGDTVWIFAALSLFMGLFMPVGGMMGKILGSRITSLIGSWLMSLSVAITYLTIKINLWTVIITYGVCVGFGSGISYSVVLTAAVRWFPHRPGLVIGIVVGGFSLGALVFNVVQTKLINPLNISPRIPNNSFVIINGSFLEEERYFYDDRVLNNVPKSFVIVGVIYATIQLVGVILLMDVDSTIESDIREIQDGDVDNANEMKSLLSEKKERSDEDVLNSKKDNVENGGSERNDYTIMEAVRDKMFWLLLMTYLLNGIFTTTITARYKTFGQLFIRDDYYFAILGSVSAIFNCSGRLMWGRLYDMSNYRIMMSSLTILMALGACTFYFSRFISNETTVKAIFFIMVCILFSAIGGSFILIPSETAHSFGYTNLATIYGLIYCGVASSGIITAILSSVLFSMIRYKGQFIIVTLASILSFILTQFFRTHSKNSK